jgi:excisionase family DNA binding protein
VVNYRDRVTQDAPVTSGHQPIQSAHPPRWSVPAPDRQHWLKVNEIAAELRVSRMTVYRLIHTNALPARQFGRSYRVNSADFAAYVSTTTTSAPTTT